MERNIATALFSTSISHAMWFYIIVGVSVACNFQIEKRKIKLLTEYEYVIQNVLFGN
jgi:hypothetical protein